jgi:hypothetical protein
MPSIPKFHLRPPFELEAKVFKSVVDHQRLDSPFRSIDYLKKLHANDFGLAQKDFILNLAKNVLRHVVLWHLGKTVEIETDLGDSSVSVEFKRALLETFNKQKVKKELVKAVEDINAVINAKFQLGEFALKQKDGMNYRLDFKASEDFNSEQGLKDALKNREFSSELVKIGYSSPFNALNLA